MPFSLPYSRSPFTDFENSVLVFQVEDPTGAETIDSSGNPAPAKIDRVLNAYLKQSKDQRISKQILDQYPGIDVNGILMEGYITGMVTGAELNGIGFGERTRARKPTDPIGFSGAKYFNQSGSAILIPHLQSSVTADHLTGLAIRLIFQRRGGE